MTQPDTPAQPVGGNVSLCTGSGALDLALSRSDQLKILGNGVVIHQAAHAYRLFLAGLAATEDTGAAA
ncbi:MULTISPECIES: hypothetical protein [unclassified Streptomyces]|uniref:hypothetical protein n=1 Tax=unclassified Streptomyces TaxID=2593676 RepID=UPI00037AA30D|nr:MULTISPECIES: hypothetical protein [unclassified Streptomyces]